MGVMHRGRPLIIIHSGESRRGEISILKRRAGGRREVSRPCPRYEISGVVSPLSSSSAPRLTATPPRVARAPRTRRRWRRTKRGRGLNVCASGSRRAIIARCGIAFVATSIGHVSMFKPHSHKRVRIFLAASFIFVLHLASESSVYRMTR